MAALVDEDLAVLGEDDADALERPRRWAFEVHAGQAETAAVARALELVLRRQIVRRAPEMRARDAERVEAAHVVLDVVRRPHHPDAVLFLPPLVDAHAVLGREPDL